MIHLKTPEEIAVMREGGKRLGKILKALRKAVKPGLKTSELDILARELLAKEDSRSAFLGYVPHGAQAGFPAALCVSVNEIVVHGLPGNYVLQDGDVVSLDMGLVYKDFYSDSAVTVGVGKISKDRKKLLAVTEKSLYAGIKAAKAGNTLGDIGFAISSVVRKAGFELAQGLTGHGIGKSLHEDPDVWNEGYPGAGEEIRPGMVLAIEPMVVMGGGKIVNRKDDSYATKDDSTAAHFEHTVAILSRGNKILTA